MRSPAIIVVLAGCFSKPPEPIVGPRDAPPDDGVDAPTDGQMFDNPMVTFTMDGAGANVDGGWFRVHFANIASGYAFPDLVSIDGIDLLGHATTAPNCHAEDAAGMAIHPAHRIAAYTSSTVDRNMLTAERLRGPAVVQLTIDWQTAVVGENAGMTPETLEAQGDSTFTIFPDGKIVRYDHMNDVAGPGNVVVTTSIDCSGSTAGGWYPTSFMTLANDPSVTELLFNAAGTQVPLPIVTNGSMDTNEQSNVCFDYGPRRVGFAWRGVAAADIGSRVRAPNAELYAFVHDFTNLHSATTIPNFSFVGESAMFLNRGPNDCAASGLSTRANEWSRPVTSHPGITFTWTGGSTLVRPGNRDGIYGGLGSGGPVTLPPTATSVTLQGNLSTTFAAWFDFDRAVPSLTVTKPGAVGPFYVAQPVAGTTDEWVVWFRDPIAGTEMITVTTP